MSSSEGPADTTPLGAPPDAPPGPASHGVAPGPTGTEAGSDGGDRDASAAAAGTDAVSRAEADAALSRVLDGTAFARSRRNRELLAHLATETLEGRADALNGTTVAQDALGKGDDFDPASDPSVRVQMGRLRRLIATHYEEEGADDTVRIVLPKGSYVPAFVRLDRDTSPATGAAPAGADEHALGSPAGHAPDAPAMRGRAAGWRAGAVSRSRLALALVALLVLAGMGGIVALWPRPESLAPRDYPVVVVRPFDNRTGDEDNDALASGFQRQFAADLQRFRTARVTLEDAPAHTGVPSGGADFTVTGAVLSADTTLDAIIWLIDARNAEIAATERLTVDAEGDDYLGALEEFSARLTAHVAAPRGQLARAAVAHFENSHMLTGDGDLGAFECFVRFNDYTANRDEAGFAPVYDCLAREVGENPTDGTLTAALGWMELVGSPEAGLLDPALIGRRTSLARALELVDRAVAVAPGDDAAHLYHGLVNWFAGSERVALDSMRRAVRLNPADPQHKADYGLFLSYAGEWERGLRYVEEAIAWDIDPPGWYRTALFFDALRRGDTRAARRVVSRGSLVGDPFAPVYLLALAGVEGDAAEVARLTPGAQALAEANDGDALAPVRRWIRSPAILGLLERELRAAGVSVRARAA